ncbi:sulfite exporter TauE/SafE family protein [Temperatibacter marinus]|uniref:Probable membrane transporter protein n=1 Tax=Temperatibacter marinus TaxID=1456591 RepID=A0AA52EHG4_9PROT|nr:sulfite exporter TauE/SafE family protein [Temperatibacter marinus]WND02584.1 sulfite exporter TauE/SafE family protein [Temperatibacter marinus]
MKAAFIRKAIVLILCMLAVGYISIAIQSPHSIETLVSRGYLFLVGVFAATIANSTGMGGGVVFLPAFEFIRDTGLAITAAQIIGMSFVIQSFGMTVGSSRWLYKAYSNKEPVTGVAEKDFWKIIGWVLLFAAPSLLLTQYALVFDKDFLLFLFKGFSIALGLKLLMATWVNSADNDRRDHLHAVDYQILAIAGITGGIATALFSVGVGELVALYLFIRNYPLVTCAATAVILSSLTILIGLPWHLMNTDLPWDLLTVVIPGAILGGYFARAFAYWLGNKRLKIFAALWIIGSSSFLLFR